MAKIQEINSLVVHPTSDPEQFMLDLGYLDEAGVQHRLEMLLSDGLFLWNLLGAALANYRNAGNTQAILQRYQAVYSKYPDEVFFPTP